MRKTIRLALLATVAIVLGTGLYLLLGGEVYLPKPPGYPRIVLPAHEYTNLPDSYPYSFEVSKHAVVAQHNSPRAQKYWIDIHYPAFEATIEITYKSVKNDPMLLHAYCAEAYRLTAKHQVKASSIQEKSLKTKQGHPIVLTALSGQVPSQVQFYTTDMKHHFLRGALYFNTASQNDYLAPVIAFIREDILHLLNTLEWK
jgi:gliding motility-associated lipoprotein GldD